MNDAPPYKPEDFPQVDGDLRAHQHPRAEQKPLPQWLIDLVKRDAGLGLSDDPDDLPPPVNPAEVDAALAAINPDSDRKTWFVIGCGLFDGLGDENGFSFGTNGQVAGKNIPN